MTKSYFYDKWQHQAAEIYNGLINPDTFKPTLELVGVVRSFSLVNDLMKVYAELEEFEKCKQLESIKKGMADGLEMV